MNLRKLLDCITPRKGKSALTLGPVLQFEVDGRRGIAPLPNHRCGGGDLTGHGAAYGDGGDGADRLQARGWRGRPTSSRWRRTDADGTALPCLLLDLDPMEDRGGARTSRHSAALHFHADLGAPAAETRRACNRYFCDGRKSLDVETVVRCN